MKQIFLVVLTTFLFSLIVCAQVDITDEELTFKEKIEKGKAYIDETFPDCDLNYFAPHFVGKKNGTDINDESSKKELCVKYRHEYELYLYFRQKEIEANTVEQEVKTESLEKQY